MENIIQKIDVAHDAGQVEQVHLASVSDPQRPVEVTTAPAPETADMNLKVETREDISRKLVLHCGAHACPRAALDTVKTPAPTQTWQPIAHTHLIEEVERIIAVNGLRILGEGHSLSHGGNRYFGLFQMGNGQVHHDYAWILGLRNSHDKVFPAGLVAGAKVFICDNLSFSGEISVSRKHTTFISRDLPMFIERAIGRLMEKWHSQDERIEAYKNTGLTDTAAHDLLVRGLDVGAMTPTQLPKVLKDWREPRHEEFAARTLWSLFNCFTETLKGGITVLPARTQALHGLLDSYAGLNVVDAEFKKLS
jgi:hypothetical protein